MIDVVELEYEESPIQTKLREYRQLYDSVMPEVLRLTGELAKVQQPLVELEAEVKRLVLDGGVSVKSSFAQATYVREGVRVKWDSKKLDGYMAAHPEIKQFRSESKTKAYVRLKVK